MPAYQVSAAVLHGIGDIGNLFIKGMNYSCVTAIGAVEIPSLIFCGREAAIFNFLEIRAKTLKKDKKCSILSVSIRGAYNKIII